MVKAKKHGVANNKNAQKEINPIQVKRLAEKFWSKSEIAAFLDCHVDTVTNRFQEVYAKGKEVGKTKLRDLQMKSAQNGNVTMQIWLGKQYLGQRDSELVGGLTEVEINNLRAIANKEIESNL